MIMENCEKGSLRNELMRKNKNPLTLTLRQGLYCIYGEGSRNTISIHGCYKDRERFYSVTRRGGEGVAVAASRLRDEVTGSKRRDIGALMI